MKLLFSIGMILLCVWLAEASMLAGLTDNPSTEDVDFGASIYSDTIVQRWKTVVEIEWTAETLVEDDTLMFLRVYADGTRDTIPLYDYRAGVDSLVDRAIRAGRTRARYLLWEPKVCYVIATHPNEVLRDSSEVTFTWR